MNKPVTNSRVTRWLLLLWEFDITIIDRRGKENNIVTYFLYRMTNNDDDTLVKDSFLDEHLFAFSSFSPW